MRKAVLDSKAKQPPRSLLLPHAPCRESRRLDRPPARSCPTQNNPTPAKAAHDQVEGQHHQALSAAAVRSPDRSGTRGAPPNQQYAQTSQALTGPKSRQNHSARQDARNNQPLRSPRQTPGGQAYRDVDEAISKHIAAARRLVSRSSSLGTTHHSARPPRKTSSCDPEILTWVKKEGSRVGGDVI
jgi:hypothetical protein